MSLSEHIIGELADRYRIERESQLPSGDFLESYLCAVLDYNEPSRNHLRCTT